MEYDNPAELQYYCNLYVMFKQYSKLGISFSPKDIDIDTLQVLYDFEVKIEEIHQKKQDLRNKRKK